jgi:hypothetical protein
MTQNDTDEGLPRDRPDLLSGDCAGENQQYSKLQTRPLVREGATT